MKKLWIIFLLALVILLMVLFYPNEPMLDPPQPETGFVTTPVQEIAIEETPAESFSTPILNEGLEFNEHIQEQPEECNPLLNNKDSYINSGTRQWVAELMHSYHEYQTDYYRTADEDLLLTGAENGDKMAMYALGMRYRWSSHDYNLDSGFFGLRGTSSADHRPKPKLDKELLDKARYWLYQAALHGEFAGLVDYRQSFTTERAKLQSSGESTPEVQRDLTIMFMSFNMLIKWVAPEYKNLFKQIKRPGHVEPRINDLHEEAEIVFEDLKTEWVNKRAKLGFPPKIKIEIPKEVKEYRQNYNACWRKRISAE